MHDGNPSNRVSRCNTDDRVSNCYGREGHNNHYQAQMKVDCTWLPNLEHVKEKVVAIRLVELPDPWLSGSQPTTFSVGKLISAKKLLDCWTKAGD